MPKTIAATIAALLAVLLALAFPVSAAVEKRVALVIGNSAYQNAVPLANPERDARAMAAKLRMLGFVVVEGYDLDHDGFKSTIKEFAMAVRGADLGLFFYAGHGMQVNGRNYFVPVDAAFRDVTALDFEAIPLELVTRQLENDVAVRIVVLDACRDNPLSQVLSRSMAGSTRSGAIQEGLAEVRITEGGEGTAIIFATSPDAVALDGEGQHSPFTTAMLAHIDAPDTPLQVVMTRITGDVYSSTGQKQRPWMNASLTGEVYLNPTANRVANVDPKPRDTPAAAEDPLQREKILYNLAQETQQIEDFEAYLERFPDGLFAANARRQIERLKAEASKKVAAVAPAQAPGQAAPPAVRNTGPAEFDLPVTDAVRAAPANELTEASLELDRAKWMEVQIRLKLAGFDTGGADGAFGPRSRRALQGWQDSRGLLQSGYLNQPQYELLMHQTEAAYATYVPERPAAPPGPAVVPGQQRTVVIREKPPRVVQPQRQYQQQPQRNTGPDAGEVGRFVGGVIGGILLRR